VRSKAGAPLALLLASVLLVTTSAAGLGVAAQQGQAQGVLHVHVTLTAPGAAPTPVPRHALLISQNPTSAVPTRVLTGPDGTAEVRLRPGNYTIESDEPVLFEGKAYHWMRIVDITAGGDLRLEMNIGNAEVEAASAAASSSNSTITDAKTDPTLLVSKWRDSVVSVWTATAHASGFLVDQSGLVVTQQRTIRDATAVEVQLTPSLKVAGRVLASDAQHDVAVIGIDPSATASIAAVPSGCAAEAGPPFSERQTLTTISSSMLGPNEIADGEVTRVDPRATLADFRLVPGDEGGPVFATDGHLAGLSSMVDGADPGRRRDVRVVPLADVCAVLNAAATSGPRAAAGTLPVEPPQLFSPITESDAATRGRASSLSAFQVSTADFEIAFLTPPFIQARRQVNGATQGREASRGVDPTDFGAWSDYFRSNPAVLVVRVTPKMAESFWTTLARGAAYTQGVALPAFKHFKPGFARMQLFCGDTELVPIHPFVLEQPISETDAVHEGLYVFAPDAVRPACGPVRISVYSEKDPAREDRRQIDPALVERVWQDFSTWRAAAGSSAP